jgi:hypothetical protein
MFKKRSFGCQCKIWAIVIYLIVQFLYRCPWIILHALTGIAYAFIQLLHNLIDAYIDWMVFSSIELGFKLKKLRRINQ